MVLVSLGGKKMDIELLDCSKVKILSNPIRIKILDMLLEKPGYASKVAEELKISPQLLNFHLKVLERAGIVKREKFGGLSIYRVDKDGFVILLGNGKNGIFSTYPKIFQGFINEEGFIDCKIVTGATYPSEDRERIDRTSYLCGEIACILGNYGKPAGRLIYWDSEIKDLKDNFILISGPLVNKLTDIFNDYLPIRFLKEKKCIYSELSKLKYDYRQTGIIVKIKNPFDKSKEILVIAGGDGYGTKIAVYSVLRHLDEIEKGNSYAEGIIARIVKGNVRDKRIEKTRFIE